MTCLWDGHRFWRVLLLLLWLLLLLLLSSLLLFSSSSSSSLLLFLFLLLLLLLWLLLAAAAVVVVACACAFARGDCQVVRSLTAPHAFSPPTCPPCLCLPRAHVDAADTDTAAVAVDDAVDDAADDGNDDDRPSCSSLTKCLGCHRGQATANQSASGGCLSCAAGRGRWLRWPCLCRCWYGHSCACSSSSSSSSSNNNNNNNNRSTKLE